ncbi:N-acetylmuramoyl-L-alanine amidase [Cytobacillus massiliigabonensis]|uniref:N-acetylmuramoyl-L-alanine amidase n=1 Tax=Cytobacillus massiliigabonensis TaxID=1871011 RepID=UPI0015E0CE13|nr:N-acetylmuramoyl-L-alanine amidase [Cytobacillus massiliigabonensis]
MTLKIMLDAGHGPNTPGKRSPDGSLREFHFNSRVADVMRAELEKYEGVTVYFAHEQLRDVPLKERTDRANKLGVDVYVSLHANAGGGTGIETFVHPKSSAKSREVAKAIQAALIKATGMVDRGVKTADFHVLRETDMPAVLIEHGFMDNAADLPKLKDDAFRVLCAKTNVKALTQVYGLKRKGAELVENNDVAGHWAEQSIKKAIANGVMSGYPDGTFGVNNPMTRAQFVAVLDKLGLLDRGTK